MNPNASHLTYAKKFILTLDLMKNIEYFWSNNHFPQKWWVPTMNLNSSTLYYIRGKSITLNMQNIYLGLENYYYKIKLFSRTTFVKLTKSNFFNYNEYLLTFFFFEGKYSLT